MIGKGKLSLTPSLFPVSRRYMAPGTKKIWGVEKNGNRTLGNRCGETSVPLTKHTCIISGARTDARDENWEGAAGGRNHVKHISNLSCFSYVSTRPA